MLQGVSKLPVIQGIEPIYFARFFWHNDTRA